MLTLEQIFEHHNNTPAKREVIFEDGLWCIYERIPAEMEGRFHLIHRCDLGTYALYMRDHSEGPPSDMCCCKCKRVPPDGIQAVFKLHKWGMGDDRAY